MEFYLVPFVRKILENESTGLFQGFKINEDEEGEKKKYSVKEMEQEVRDLKRALQVERQEKLQPAAQ